MADPRPLHALRPLLLQDLFDLGSVKELFAIKCQESFVAFEKGELIEPTPTLTLALTLTRCAARHRRWGRGALRCGAAALLGGE